MEKKCLELWLEIGTLMSDLGWDTMVTSTDKHVDACEWLQLGHWWWLHMGHWWLMRWQRLGVGVQIPKMKHVQWGYRVWQNLFFRLLFTRLCCNVEAEKWNSRVMKPCTLYVKQQPSYCERLKALEQTVSGVGSVTNKIVSPWLPSKWWHNKVQVVCLFSLDTDSWVEVTCMDRKCVLQEVLLVFLNTLKRSYWCVCGFYTHTWWALPQRERERENSNSNSKTLFYKDCSLGSVKNLSNNLSLLSYWWIDIKLQALFIFTFRHEWVSETLYMRISKQNIVCSQHQMNTCHTWERERERQRSLTYPNQQNHLKGR